MSRSPGVGNCELRGTLPIFLSDVKARHDKMVELVETMMMAHGLRLTAYGRRTK